MSKRRQRRNSRGQITAKKQRNDQPVIRQEVSQQFSGPIPPPEILKQYNEVDAGAAGRIIAMAEQEARHRRSMEQSIISHEYKEAGTGQKFALFIGSLAIIAGSTISVMGAQWAGIVIGGGGVVSLVSIFVYGRKNHSAKE